MLVLRADDPQGDQTMMPMLMRRKPLKLEKVENSCRPKGV